MSTPSVDYRVSKSVPRLPMHAAAHILSVREVGAAIVDPASTIATAYAFAYAFRLRPFVAGARSLLHCAVCYVSYL